MSSFMSNNVSRRNFVKLIGAAGAISASAALVGCDNSTPEPAAGSDEGSGSAEGTAGAAFKVGHIGPLTGAAAAYGTATSYGAQVAIDEINAAGGAVAFDYNTQDDEADPEKAVNAYNTLKDWGMQVLVGCTTTGACVAVSTETNNDRIFELTPSASSTDVVGGQEDADGNVTIARKDNVFQMCFTDPSMGTMAAEYISANSLGTKVAVIYNNADAYSTGIYNTFMAKAGEVNLEVVSETTFTDDSATDFSVQVGEAKDAGADLVFLPIYYTPASQILAEAQKQEFAPSFFGVDGMDGILTLEGFDAALAEDVMLLTPFNANSSDAAVQSFVESFQALSGGTVPNQFAADAYDCVYAIAAAIEQAGVTADQSAADICDALTGVFASGSFTFDGLTGSNMTWDETGMVTKAPNVVVIKDGVYVDM